MNNENTQKTKHQIPNTNKGITLIALVITIIVMLILVSVTISMAVNGGLFEKAGEAVSDTKEALNEEQALAEGKIQIGGAWYDSIDKFLAGEKSFESYPEYSTSLLNSTGVLTENTKYTDANKEVAVIPKGFYLTNVEDEINEGIVIEDANENQFVWVPVKTGEFERTGWKDNEPVDKAIIDKTIAETTEDWEDEDYMQAVAEIYGFDNVEDFAEDEGCVDDEGKVNVPAVLDMYGYETWEDFYKNEIYNSSGVLSENYTENSSNDPTGEYNKMVASVEKYGGFYIGRYEAGSEENRREDDTLTPDTTTLGVRKGLYPYNMVCWGTSMTEWEEEREYTSGSTTYDYGYGAVYLSRNMYTNKEAYGVTSTLCYGVQWDAVLRFVKEEEEVDVTNSTNWGNYHDHEFEFTGKYSTDNGITWDDDETEKPEDEYWLLKTGASEENQAKNIYDLAGNVYEWTMEANSSGYRVYRGGDFSRYGGDYRASVRGSSVPTISYYSRGFRPTLYIK